MAYNTILIKRRVTGAAGAPGSLQGGELAFNEVDSTMYYGSANGVIAIAGSGTFATNSLVDSLTASLDSRITSEVTNLNTTIASVSSTLDTRITTAIADLVDGAPELLNTLNELASALGDDENFATTITGNIAANTSLINELSGTVGSLNIETDLAIAALSAELKGDIANEVADLDADVVALSAAVDQEVVDRAQAITDVTTELQSVSSALDTKIDTEVTGLETLIQSVSSTIAEDFAAGDTAVTDYVHAGFLPLSGGDLTGGVTVTGNISASGTITAAGGLEIAGGSSGDATLFVGGGMVGIGTEAPNEELTVVGSISATESIFAANATFAGEVTVAEPTQSGSAATKNYVDGAISALVDGAPALLDTLNELASALGNDENFATTVAGNIAANTSLINELSGTVGSLTTETDLAIASLSAELKGDIATEVGFLDADVVALSAAIDQEVVDRAQAITDLTTELQSVSSTLDIKIDTEISGLSAAVDANFVEKTEADAVTLNGGLTVTTSMFVDVATATFTGDLSGNGTTSTLVGFVFDGGEF